MASPISKLRPTAVEPASESRIIDISEEEAHETFTALASETSHRLYALLCEEPATASELSDRMDTSLQNLSYHIDKLEASGLIEAVGTRYSSRGREMTVYAPRHDPLVFTGDADSERSLRTELPRILSSVAIVAGVGLLGQWAAQVTGLFQRTPGSVGPAGIGASPTNPTTLLFQPGVLLALGALLMGLVVLAFELR